MYRIERGAEVSPGRWSWVVAGTDLRGVSHQPLLDACRAIKTLDGYTCGQQAAIWREGMVEWDVCCTVEGGAALTVSDGDKRIRFMKWKPFDRKLR
jgi:hypothetical protein